MKHRKRIYYSEADKALMWDRWQKGILCTRLPACLTATIAQFGASSNARAVFVRRHEDVQVGH